MTLSEDGDPSLPEREGGAVKPNFCLHTAETEAC